MGRSVKIFSAERALWFYEFREEFNSLPRVHRVFLALHDGDRQIALVNYLGNVPTLLSSDRVDAGITLPGTYLPQGEDPKEALRKMMRQRFGITVHTALSKIGPSLWRKGKNADGKSCVFVDSVYFTSHKARPSQRRYSLKTLIKSRFEWYEHVNAGTLSEYARGVITPKDGTLGSIPVMLALAFSAIPLLKNEEESLAEEYTTKMINGLCCLAGKNDYYQIFSPAMWSNKFLGFESSMWIDYYSRTSTTAASD